MPTMIDTQPFRALLPFHRLAQVAVARVFLLRVGGKDCAAPPLASLDDEAAGYDEDGDEAADCYADFGGEGEPGVGCEGGFVDGAVGVAHAYDVAGEDVTVEDDLFAVFGLLFAGC